MPVERLIKTPFLPGDVGEHILSRLSLNSDGFWGSLCEHLLRVNHRLDYHSSSAKL